MSCSCRSCMIFFTVMGCNKPSLSAGYHLSLDSTSGSAGRISDILHQRLCQEDARSRVYGGDGAPC